MKRWPVKTRKMNLSPDKGSFLLSGEEEQI